MRTDEDMTGPARAQRIRLSGPGLLRRLLTYGATVVLLVLAVMFSAVILSLLALAGLLVAGFLWWKTRSLRKMARQFDEQASGYTTEAAGEDAPSGVVIEGEAEVIREIREIREIEPRNRIEN